MFNISINEQKMLSAGRSRCFLIMHLMPDVPFASQNLNWNLPALSSSSHLLVGADCFDCIQANGLTRMEMMFAGGRIRLAPMLLVVAFLPLMHASSRNNGVEFVRRAERLARALQAEESMESSLLTKAVPIEEYNARLIAAGAKPLEREPEFMRVPSSQRRLEDADEDDDDADDYYVADEYLTSFSGFALKYVKCQPIQRFSVDAIQNGEYSSMVTNDVVMLRLCPRKQCSGSSSYGCLYNYAEYAIGLSEYLQIMIKFTQNKRENLCNFCAECNNNSNRFLSEDEEESEEEYNEYEEEDEYEEAYDDNVDYDDDGNSDSYCSTYADLCDDYESICDGDEDEAGGSGDEDNTYIGYDDYLDYLDCVKVEGQGNYEGSNMYLRPRCDASAGTIKMGVFYDPYCSQYGGDDLSAKQFSGIAFRSSAFENFYSSSCIDCSESVSFAERGFQLQLLIPLTVSHRLCLISRMCRTIHRTTMQIAICAIKCITQARNVPQVWFTTNSMTMQTTQRNVPLLRASVSAPMTPRVKL